MPNIIATSDIHGFQPQFSAWGDVIVLAGDLTTHGKAKDTSEFSRWLVKLAKEFKHVVFVAGNHDFFFEKNSALLDSFKAEWNAKGNIHYLEDSGVTIDGVKFWGSPWTPKFGGWAFMEEDCWLARYWDMIPTDTDVLITHGPPKAILDYTSRYGAENVGSETLRQAVLGRILPKVHIFGHIHEDYGYAESLGKPTVKFYNVAYCDVDYEPVNRPQHIIVEGSANGTVEEVQEAIL